MKPLAAVALAVMALTLSGPASAGGGGGGEIVDYQQKVTKVVEFLNLVDQYAYVYEGENQTLAMKDVRSLELVGADKVRITTTGGKTLTVIGTLGVAPEDTLAYTAVNPLTQKAERMEMAPELIRTIRIQRP